jgi:hypothetical protein
MVGVERNYSSLNAIQKCALNTKAHQEQYTIFIHLFLIYLCWCVRAYLVLAYFLFVVVSTEQHACIITVSSMYRRCNGGDSCIMYNNIHHRVIHIIPYSRHTHTINPFVQYNEYGDCEY